MTLCFEMKENWQMVLVSDFADGRIDSKFIEWGVQWCGFDDLIKYKTYVL